MADAAATIWATAITGITTLLGVGLGSWLGYGTTKRINEQQSRDAKRSRKVSQLERLDRILEGIENLTANLLTQSVGKVGHGFKFEASKLSRASLVECEFFVSVYLPEAKPDFGRLKKSFAEVGRIVGEIILVEEDKDKGSKLLLELVNAEGEIDRAIKAIRDGLFESARAIEEI